MKVSILIATKDRPLRLKKCMSHIEKQTRPPDEVIIVDGSSVRFGGKWIGGPGRKTKVVYINKKSTMVQARNIGIRRARGDVVLFLDDDAFIEKDYVKELLGFYLLHPEAGGAEGNIINDTNKRLLERLFNFPAFPGRDDVMRVSRLHGCNMSFRKEIFRNLMFDEKLIGYYNDDDDFCAFAAKKYKLFFVPRAKLIHDQTQYGGARIDNYKNYNTLVFNQFYSFTKMPEKTVFDVLGYIMSQSIMIVRAFIFVKVDKHLAIKGIFRGYSRVVKSVLKGNYADEIGRL